MTSTVFSSGTVITAPWLNDVNNITYNKKFADGSVALSAQPGTSLDSSAVSYVPAGTNAVATTVQAKLRQTVSVKDFGAVGDGTTNDTAAIVAALAASNTVFFPAGTYLTTGNINIQNKSLYGVSSQSSIIKLSGTNTNTPVFTNSATTNTSSDWGSGLGFSLSNLTVAGNWDGTTANSVPIDNFTSLGSVVTWYMGSYCKVLNCVIKNSFAHGLGFYCLGYSQIQFNEVSTNKYDGVHLYAPNSTNSITSTWVSNNSIHSCRGYGAVYINEALTCQVTQNVFEDVNYAVYISGQDNRNVAVDYNDMEQCYTAGIAVVGNGLNFSIQNNFTAVTSPLPPVITPNVFSGIVNNNFTQKSYTSSLPTTGNGTANGAGVNSGWIIDVFGGASSGASVGQLQWRSNNNYNATIPIGMVRTNHAGTANQLLGALIFSTANGSAITDYLTLNSNGSLYPNTDNTQPLGQSSNRWSVVYAGTGTINTSDANQKQDFASLNAAELATAKTIKGLLKTYKFKSAVAKKGADARIHFGVSAQEVEVAFTTNDLDANKYGLFCSDTWYVDAKGDVFESNKDENGNVIAELTSVTQLGIRYDELLAFVIAAL